MGGGDEGFTLTELLVVIVVLGVLSAIAVFAVTGLPEKGQSSAAQTDEATLVKAEEAFFAKQPAGAGRYATEAELVQDRMLQGPSSLHDVCVSADRGNYKVVAAGDDCTAVAFPP